MRIQQNSEWNEWRTYLIGSMPANELIARSEMRCSETLLSSRCGYSKGDQR
jgi:hypothetical protein